MNGGQSHPTSISYSVFDSVRNRDDRVAALARMPSGHSHIRQHGADRMVAEERHTARGVRAICTLFIVLLLLMAGTMERSRAETITFDGFLVGSTPSDFDIWRTGQGGGAQWIVVPDQTTQGGLALEQVSQDKTDSQ